MKPDFHNDSRPLIAVLALRAAGLKSRMICQLFLCSRCVQCHRLINDSKVTRSLMSLCFILLFPFHAVAVNICFDFFIAFISFKEKEAILAAHYKHIHQFYTL